MADSSQRLPRIVGREAAGRDFPPQGFYTRAYDRLTPLLSVPTVSKVTALTRDGHTELQVALAHKDLVSDKVEQSTCAVVVPEHTAFASALVTTPVPAATAAADTWHAPSGATRVVLRANGALRFDVWRGACKAFTLEVPETLHGQVLIEDFFSTGPVWSADESAVAACVQRPEPQPAKDSGGGGGSGGGASLLKREVRDAEWQEDWGELHTGKQPPAVYVLDLRAKSVVLAPGQAGEASFGQPQWSPEGGLLMVAWPHEQTVFPNLKQRLGLVFCFPRNCHLVLCPEPLAHRAAASGRAPPPSGARKLPALSPEASPRPSTDGAAAGAGDATGGAAEAPPLEQTGIAIATEPALTSAMEPRFSPDGKQLVFVSHDQACRTGVHHAAAALHVADWGAVAGALSDAPQDGGAGGEAAAAQRTLKMPHRCVVTAEQPEAAPSRPEVFPGLYCATLAATLLPPAPFLGNSSRILVNSLWHECAAVLTVDLRSGAVARQTSADGCYTVATRTPHAVFAARSTLDTLPGVCAVATQVLAVGDAKGSWTDVGPLLGAGSVPEDVTSALASFTVELQTTSDGNQVPSLVILPKGCKGTPVPAVLFMHGGPHAASTNAFTPPLAYLAAAGFAIVLPNYRGSSGYGEAHLQALPGRIGELDIGDCMAALDALTSARIVDGERVGVCGGSHGGFLTGHALWQHAGRFKCAIMRNPVLDLPLMVRLSDIPDWCFVEAFGASMPSRDGTGGAVPTRKGAQLPLAPAAHERLHAASPIAALLATDAGAGPVPPLMMFLGAKDRRVPMADGLAYAKASRAAGRAVEVHVFEEDTHSLGRPATSLYQWVRVLPFLDMHLLCER